MLAAVALRLSAGSPFPRTLSMSSFAEEQACNDCKDVENGQGRCSLRKAAYFRQEPDEVAEQISNVLSEPAASLRCTTRDGSMTDLQIPSAR